MLDQNKINFLKQAISLLQIKAPIKYYSQGTRLPVFTIEIRDSPSLDMKWSDGEGNFSALLKVINLLGQCKAGFNASPVNDEMGNFDHFEIVVEDITPVWDSDKYVGNFATKK